MIRTKAVAHCPICSSGGETLYADLRDRLFDTPGLWHVRRCSGPQCGMLWLDPAPVAEDIHLAYRKYYTHQDAGIADDPPARGAWRGYRAWVFGTARFPATLREKLMGLSFFLLPNRKVAVEYPIRQLHDMPNGLALEIGCGSGRLMQDVVAMGWKAIGIDFDASAVESARSKGLDARVGDLASHPFAEGSFDAVLMNHVIEHLPDAGGTLRQIMRLLRPGGRLLCVTPNGESWGHKRFVENWRGLEPPRHLQIFNRRSLHALAKSAGFERSSVRVSVRSSIQVLEESLMLEKPGINARSFPARVYLELVWFWEWVLTRLGRNAGEELLLVAEK